MSLGETPHGAFHVRCQLKEEDSFLNVCDDLETLHRTWEELAAKREVSNQLKQLGRICRNNHLCQSYHLFPIRP